MARNWNGVRGIWLGSSVALSTTLVGLLAAACGGGSSTGVAPGGSGLALVSDPDVVLSTGAPVFTVQVLHAADQEAGVDAIDFAPRFSAVLSGLRAQFPNTLTLASGDLWIPGPFYNATGGQADAAINSALGFQAATLGNHEFDLGTDALSGLIGDLTFPYLSANLDFSPSNLQELVTGDGQPAESIEGQIARSATITVGGETFGIIGATTPLLPTISSPGNVAVFPSNPDDLAGLAAIIQQQVDSLSAQGINKIILLAHLQQIQNEIALASLLRDVDIIIAGGSDTLLANPTDRVLGQFGKSPSGVYPLLFNSASGQPVALVNTDREYRYVGRLIVGFDTNGILAQIDTRSGAYAADDQGVAESGGSPIPAVVDAVNEVRTVLVEKDGSIFGSSTVFLNGERQDVRTRETNLGNITADANLFTARLVDPTVVGSLKNGGGIRASIGGIEPGGEGNRVPPLANPLTGKQDGEISQLDIENALRFNNGLSLLTLTAENLKAIVEHGVATAAPGATPGRFPQVGGFAFSFDPGLPAGSRVRSLVLIDDNGNTTETVVANGSVVDPSRSYRIVTLDFLAGGGDGYPFDLGTNRVEVSDLIDGMPTILSDPGGEQDALARFLLSRSPITAADTPIEQNQRIQNLSVRGDTLLN